MKPEFVLTKNLRFIPKDRESLEIYIVQLKNKLKASQDLSERVNLQGELGVHLRALDLFDEAEAALQEVIEIIKENGLGLRKEIQNKIRLAHVFQEAKKFKQSNLLFVEIIRLCRTVDELNPLFHFALQHAGKNEFDQGKYSSALQHFEETLSLRLKELVPLDQIESTRTALARTKEVIGGRLILSDNIEVDDNLVLKAVSLKEAAHFLQIICENKKHFESFEFISPQFESLEAVESVIQVLNKHKADFSGVSYGLWNGANLLGLFTINEILWHESSADLGFWLSESATGKGFAIRAFTALVQNCFEKLNLQCVTATTAVSNLKCRKILNKMGFVQEKELPGNIQVKGKSVDESLFRLTKESFESSLSEPWAPISVEEIKSLFSSVNKPYWISGGWALDLYLGRQTRYHEDLDIAISRTDQLQFQEALRGWDLRASDPPGSGKFRPWLPGEALNPPIHNIWCRKNSRGPWNLEVMLCTFENEEWIYRRNPRIRGPISSFGWQQEDGTRIIAPEIQLLYKSRNPRGKDTLDFEMCIHVFSKEKIQWLYDAILSDSGSKHSWIEKLKGLL
ncbi:MAG: GNAT family N-acetyltransferase [Pseudobdellovibrionaceae bacterium]